MTKVVRCFACSNLSKASWTIRSLSVSKALVASSSSSTAGLRTNARAIAMRCFWPPLSCAPRSPTSVWYFLGKLDTKSCAFAALAALSTSCRRASPV
mmetsp:Transcript_119437/g.297901  ORF Transcript_119437/g.297901 Transcript_119437/m.297901 type:complete len:97 (-) Transcript_119437:223-513(-)